MIPEQPTGLDGPGGARPTAWPLCLVAGALLALGLLPTAAVDALAWVRPLAGDALWRFLTAHVVHLGFAHAVLNAAALVLLAGLVGPLLPARQWAAHWVLASLAISSLLWLTEPELVRYVGASGVLHAIAATGGILMFRTRPFEAACLVGGLILKLGWEATRGGNPATADLIGGAIVTESHLFGTMAGAAFALWVLLRRPPELCHHRRPLG